MWTGTLERLARFTVDQAVDEGPQPSRYSTAHRAICIHTHLHLSRRIVIVLAGATDLLRHSPSFFSEVCDLPSLGILLVLFLLALRPAADPLLYPPRPLSHLAALPCLSSKLRKGRCTSDSTRFDIENYVLMLMWCVIDSLFHHLPKRSKACGPTHLRTSSKSTKLSGVLADHLAHRCRKLLSLEIARAGRQ